ncbi:MAG: hypothetical protein AXW17_13840, partial [Colwellia sp. Phe_37]
MSNHVPMVFRTDLNALRAVAVVAVVLFHFYPSILPGGYVGVDVFFVVSGFLMTKKIYEKLLMGDFSFYDFYLSRARRIIPALAFLCFVLLVMGWFYLTPYKYLELGKHVAASLGFISNIIYWKDVGYFDSAAHDKWLLHTWSLSVEWQFYILYPVVLFVLFKFFNKKLMIIFFSLLAISSLFFSHYLSGVYEKASFFLLPTRAWEMLFGGFVYFFENKTCKVKKVWVQLFGVLLVLFPMFLFDKESLWPSFYTLVPVFGVMLIVFSGKDGFFLKNPIVSFLGLISYSVYLWHWPVLVFMNYMGASELGLLYGIGFSLLLGVFSYYLIENRFFLGRVFVVSFFIFSLGSLVYFYNGVYWRDIKGWAEVIRSPLAYDCQPENIEGCDLFSNKNPTWAVIGNSHAVEISYVLANKLKEKDGIKQFTYAGCDLSYGREIESDCKRWTEAAVNNIINNESIKNVVISFRLSSSLFGDQLANYPDIPDSYPALGAGLSKQEGRKKILDSFTSMINDISKSGKNVYVILPIPELDVDISKKA